MESSFLSVLYYRNSTAVIWIVFLPPVRMAERSKAPDSRLYDLPITQWDRAFWSPNGGVGSNPTPDSVTFFTFFFFSNIVF